MGNAVKKSKDMTKTIERRFSFLRTLFAVLIALAIAFVLIATVSEKPLQDFIRESNRGSDFFFTPTRQEAIDRLSLA